MALVRDPSREEMERLEEREAYEREDAQRAAQREHEYRLAKLKYVTAGKYRMWGRVLIAFAKMPAWFVLAIVHRGEAPDYWKKFLEM